MMTRPLEQQLPIQDLLPELKRLLLSHDNLVLEAPPGAGKTTVVPLSLLVEPWLVGQKILMLEPRRLAARAAAERMAQQLGEQVGATVGYRVRLDNKVSAATKIEVITEGILTRMLQDDPALEGVGLVIFDEFHERSLDGDLGLALTLQGRELFGDIRDIALKVLVMSATLDGANISDLLNQAPVLRSEGRMFPVKTIYGDPYRYNERIEDRVVACVQQALTEQQGSLLVFLPGQGEIRRVFQRLQAALATSLDGEQVVLTPLYGDLSLAEQRRAINPCELGLRKVVLATNIAETSLTINGVRVVIDSGLCRQPVFDPNTGMTRLSTQRISKSSATQRAGRAGRIEPGVCYRLWSATQQDELAPFAAPEIQQADLAPLALQLLQWGVNNPQELSWLDAPAVAPYQQALDLLIRLGAVVAVGERVENSGDQTPNYHLTHHGEAMARLATHPRLSHMMLMGQGVGLAHQACELAALLGERDLLPGGSADIQTRLELLHSGKSERLHAGAIARIKQLQQQYLRQLPKESQSLTESPAVTGPDDYCWTGLLLAWAYPDRIARQRADGGSDYLLSNGRAAALRQHDPLSRERWLAIGQLGGPQGRSQDQIFLASALDEQWFTSYLKTSLRESMVVEWSEQQDKLTAEARVLLGSLILTRKQLIDISSEHRSEALLGVVRRRGLTLLNWSKDLLQWRSRIELLRSLDEGNSLWPDMSDEGLLSSLEVWLLPYLDKVTKLSHFKQLDLTAMLATLLPWPLPLQLDQQAPVCIRVPSGSNIAIDYSQSPPVLAVKLQEMFGCENTPTIAEGRVTLLVHLLSPAQRPLQVTQDLAAFWRGSYHDVKKEMKGRYPRHPWPDNPLEALATGKTKRRLK